MRAITDRKLRREEQEKDRRKDQMVLGRQTNMTAANLAPILRLIFTVSRCSLLHPLCQETIIHDLHLFSRIIFLPLKRGADKALSPNRDLARVDSLP